MRWLESSREESRELATTMLGATDVNGDPCILNVIEVLDPLFPTEDIIAIFVSLMSRMWSVR